METPFPIVVKQVITRLFSLMAAEYPAMTAGPKPLIRPWMMILPTEIKLCCKMLGMAMTTIRFSRPPSNSGAFSPAQTFSSLRTTTMTASTQLMPWHRKVAQATPATPIRNALTKRISTAILEREETARK